MVHERRALITAAVTALLTILLLAYVVRLIGRLFDTIGRRPMIAFTYIMSGVLLAATGYLFVRDLITAETQTLCWMAIFFFALNDALGKWLVADYSVGQLMLLRSIGAGVVLAPMILSLRVKVASSVFSTRRTPMTPSRVRNGAMMLAANSSSAVSPLSSATSRWPLR